MKPILQLTRLALLLAVAAGNTALASAAGDAAPAKAEASIPFAARGGIRDWNAKDDLGIWLQNRSGRWYYATFFAPCIGVQFETAIRILPGPTGSLDKWGGIATRQTGRCTFKSLTESSPPPTRSKKKGPDR